MGDLGVFRDEAVFTVYLNPATSADDPGPPWALQYSVMGGGPIQDLTPPFPTKKVAPVWPTDLLARYAGQEMVVSGIIDVGGRMQRLRILKSPNVDLSGALLAALDRWVFRPGTMNGQPIALKIVLGVPITAVQ